MRRGLKASQAATILLVLSALAACVAEADSVETIPEISHVELDEDERLRVVATTSIVANTVARVGDDNIELVTLIPRGQDPHGYEPRPSALASIERAHVVFINGFGLEEALLDSVMNTARGPIVPVSAGIEPRHADSGNERDNDEGEDAGDVHDEAHRHGAVDPHVWLDPGNVAIWVDNIERVLSQLDEPNREEYARNAQDFRDQLAELDTSIRKRIGEIEPEQRRIVADHDLFGYFADAYGLEILGAMVPGPTTSGESSAKQISKLVDLLKRENIDTILIGESSSSGIHDLAEAIAGELGSSVAIVRVLTGSLTEPDGPGGTYLEYIEHNTSVIVRSLTDRGGASP